MAATTAQQLLTVAEAADRLQMTNDGVYKLIKRGRLRAIRLSERKTRIAADSLDAYIAASQAWADQYVAAQPRAPRDTVVSAFITETGMTPEDWLAAWKRDELEDTPENMALLVRAAGLRAQSAA